MTHDLERRSKGHVSSDKKSKAASSTRDGTRHGRSGRQEAKRRRRSNKTGPERPCVHAASDERRADRQRRVSRTTAKGETQTTQSQNQRSPSRRRRDRENPIKSGPSDKTRRKRSRRRTTARTPKEEQKGPPLPPRATKRYRRRTPLVIYIRHGDDTHRESARARFHEHDHPLNAKGYARAGRIARALVAKFGPPSTIYCSPFQRARETIDAMVEALPSVVKRSRVRIDPGLSRYFSRREQKNPGIGPVTRAARPPLRERDGAFGRRCSRHYNGLIARHILCQADRHGREAAGPSSRSNGRAADRRHPVIWCVTHALVMRRVAQHAKQTVPDDHVPFGGWFALRPRRSRAAMRSIDVHGLGHACPERAIRRVRGFRLKSHERPPGSPAPKETASTAVVAARLDASLLTTRSRHGGHHHRMDGKGEKDKRRRQTKGAFSADKVSPRHSKRSAHRQREAQEDAGDLSRRHSHRHSHRRHPRKRTPPVSAGTCMRASDSPAKPYARKRVRFHILPFHRHVALS